MRVLVLWSDSKSTNMGVRALASGAEYWSKNALGESTVVEHQDYLPGADGVSFGFKSALKDFLRIDRSISKKIESFDLVIDTGAGDSFTDIYGAKRFLNIFYIQMTALKARNVKFVMSPQTIGPFNTWWGRRLSKLVLKRANLVFSRDDLSTAFAEDLGRVVNGQTSDLVFTLPAPDVSKRNDILINVSGLLMFSDAHFDSKVYEFGIIKIISHLRMQGYGIKLLAHVVDNPSPDNDVRACESIRDLYFNQTGYELQVLIPVSLEETREIIGSSRLVIGARMHACLNALSCDIPTFAHAYSRKFAPLFDKLGWDGYVELSNTEDFAAETIKYVDTKFSDKRPSVRDTAFDSFSTSLLDLKELMQ